MDIRLKGSILFARDMARMARFYRDVLGLTPVESEHSSEEWQAFDAGGGLFALHAIPSPYRERTAIADPPAPRYGSPHKPVFVVGDLRAAHDELVRKGVRPTDNRNLNPPGEFVRSDFIDPEGNIFQLTSR